MTKLKPLFLAGLTLPGLLTLAGADTLIRDTFQENTQTEIYQHTELTGVKAAPINLPGANWQLASGDDTYETFLTPATAAPDATTHQVGATAYFHNVASDAISLASSGSYTKPAKLTIKADLSFVGTVPTGYALLGFYSALVGKSSAEPLTNFTGLQLLQDGSLQMVENGTAAGKPIAFTGKYDPTKPTTLTYTIDTAKGTISDVSLAGSTSTYTFTTSALTDAATAFAGIGGQTNGEALVAVNNFEAYTGQASPPSPAPAAAPASSTPAPSVTPPSDAPPATTPTPAPKTESAPAN